jgi:hypothetical protein
MLMELYYSLANMIDSNLYSYSRVRVRVKVEESYSSSQEALVGEVVFQSNCGLVEALATVHNPAFQCHMSLCAAGNVSMGPEQIPWLLGLKPVAAAAQRPAS